VRPGDTLYAIAARHRTHADAIARENHLGASAMLRPGQRLRIP